MLRSIFEQSGKADLRGKIFPRSRIESAAEFDEVVNTGIIRGYEPDAPLISKTTRIITAGSCFAENVAKQLNAAGYAINHAAFTDNLFTPLALQLFMDCLREERWQEMQANWGIGDEGPALRQAICSGAVLIITFGLSTVWVDKRTGLPTLDPTTKTHTADGHGVRKLPDPRVYAMSQMSVADIKASMSGIISSIRAMSPAAPVILTVSPIPLAFSASNQPVIVADCLSKSGLRISIDELRSSPLPGVYYFPSFEILRWFATMIEPIWFEDGILSHIRHDWINYTVSKFRQFYCENEQPVVPPIG